MPKVLVIDASERQALAVIRSLGMKGVEVVVADDSRFNLGFPSKYCKRKIMYPSPKKDYKRFLRYLLEVSKKEKFDLLIPFSELTIVMLCKHKEEFDPYVRVAVPPYETMLKAYDKSLTLKIAAQQGVPHPKTLFVENIEDLRIIAREMKYPAVIKPRTKIAWINGSAIMMKVTEANYVHTAGDLITKYRKIALKNKAIFQRQYLPMIQEYIPGRGYGVETLFCNSEPRAIFVHKRLREYPITGGPSTLRVSVKNEKLVDLAVKMLKSMNWHGVAMVEFKMDERDGEPKLMEVNGRFWGSLPLAIACGVDFPYLLYKLMLNGDVVSQFDYKVGVERRWLIPGDLLWLLSSFKSNTDKLHRVLEFLKSFKTADDILSIDDPLPALGAVGMTIKYVMDILSGRINIYGETV